MAEAIKDQLAATRTMLTQLQGTEHFDTFSASQCNVVVRLVQSSKISVPELASILEVVNSTGFVEVHRQQLLGVIGKKSVTGSADVVTGSDQKYQNWESFKSFPPSVFGHSCQMMRPRPSSLDFCASWGCVARRKLRIRLLR